MPEFRLDKSHKPGEVQDLSSRGSWHPSLFREGEIDTLPFEHEYVIAYRGTAREIFFDFDTSSMMRGDSKGGKSSYGSILKQGYLNPENTYWLESDYQQKPYKKWKRDWKGKIVKEGISEEKAEQIWQKYMALMREKQTGRAEKEFEEYLSSLNISRDIDKLIPKERNTIKHPGVFFADWKVAQYYGRSEVNSVLLEAQMPTSNLSVIVRPPDKQNPSSVERDMEFRNADELQQNIGRESFRRLCRRSVEEPANEIVQYVWRSELSLNYVSGVYDSGISDEGLLMTLSDYVRELKREEALKMRDITFLAEEEGEIKQKLNILRTVENELRVLVIYLEGIEEGYEKVVKAISSIKTELGDNWIRKAESNKNKFRKEFSLMRRGLAQIQKNLKGKNTPDAEGYNSVRKDLVKFLESKNIKIDSREFSNIGELYSADFEEMIESIKNDVGDIEDLLNKERKDSQKLSFDEEMISQEKAFQRKIDRLIQNEISELPDLAPLGRKISESLKSDDMLRAVK